MIRTMERRLTVGALAAAIAACATPADLKPAVGPGTEYPCGVGGVPCGGGMCCPPDYTCGGAFPNVGCPSDVCCFIGVDELGATPHSPTCRQYPQGSRE